MNFSQLNMNLDIDLNPSYLPDSCNCSKKFQKFQDHKMRVCKDDVDKLQTAKVEGTLHETLLDRRSKMKADRYCK